MKKHWRSFRIIILTFTAFLCAKSVTAQESVNDYVTKREIILNRYKKLNADLVKKITRWNLAVSANHASFSKLNKINQRLCILHNYPSSACSQPDTVSVLVEGEVINDFPINQTLVSICEKTELKSGPDLALYVNAATSETWRDSFAILQQSRFSFEQARLITSACVSEKGVTSSKKQRLAATYISAKRSYNGISAVFHTLGDRYFAARFCLEPFSGQLKMRKGLSKPDAVFCTANLLQSDDIVGALEWAKEVADLASYEQCIGELVKLSAAPYAVSAPTPAPSVCPHSSSRWWPGKNFAKATSLYLTKRFSDVGGQQ